MNLCFTSCLPSGDMELMALGGLEAIFKGNYIPDRNLNTLGMHQKRLLTHRVDHTHLHSAHTADCVAQYRPFQDKQVLYVGNYTQCRTLAYLQTVAQCAFPR